MQSDLNAAFDLLNLIDIECLGRRTVDYCSSSDVEPGAVTLAHDSGAREQTAGERTWLMATGAEVVQCVQTVRQFGHPERAIGRLLRMSVCSG